MSNHRVDFCFSFLTQAWDKKKNVRMYRRMRRWEEGESVSNRQQSVLRVKGQPPESVNAVTVGTDQSQCLSSIDQTWAHAHVDTHLDTH